MKDTELVLKQRSHDLSDNETIRKLLQSAAKYAQQSDAPGTVESYRSAIRTFLTWAEELKIPLEEGQPVPPVVAIAWATWMADRGLARATIEHRRAAMNRWHKDRGFPSPFSHQAVEQVKKGIFRAKKAPQKKKKHLTPEMIRRFVLDPKTKFRHKVILVLGFVTGCRRSELISLMWEDLIEYPEGFTCLLRSSKTDQHGHGHILGIPHGRKDEFGRLIEPATCPVEILKEWRRRNLSKYKILGGPILGVKRSGPVIYAVKAAAVLSGENPDDYGAHSLRASLITIADEKQVSTSASMSAVRHKNPAIHAGYVRAKAALQNEAHRAAAESL